MPGAGRSAGPGNGRFADGAQNHTLDGGRIDLDQNGIRFFRVNKEPLCDPPANGLVVVVSWSGFPETSAGVGEIDFL